MRVRPLQLQPCPIPAGTSSRRPMPAAAGHHAAHASRAVRTLLLLVCAVLLGWPASHALAQERLAKREILALYDSRFDLQQFTHVHKLAEMPLNHLGYSLTYWDVEKGLPDIRSIERYKGVLTWFGRPVSKPELYLPWAAEVVDRGL